MLKFPHLHHSLCVQAPEEIVESQSQKEVQTSSFTSLPLTIPIISSLFLGIFLLLLERQLEVGGKKVQDSGLDSLLG